MPELTTRLEGRIRRDFRAGDADEVVGCLAGLPVELFDFQDPERVMAAVVLASEGRLDRFISLFRLLQVDWRDALVAGGLAGDDWPDRLDAELPDT